MDKNILSSGAVFHASRGDVLDNVRAGFEVLNKIGFKGIDLNTAAFSNITDDREKLAADILDAAKANDIVFAQCHLPFVSQKQGTPDGADGFNNKVFAALELARALGIKYAVMHPNTTSVPLEGYDKNAQYDRVMTFFAPFVEYAGKVGVEMVIENMRSVQGAVPSHRYCASPDELCDIADACGIGVCWDTGHANITGLCQSEALEFVGNRLKVLHLNDNVGDDDIHVAPFMGTVDWADVIKGLKNIGFDGAINFEVTSRRVPDTARLDFGKYIYKTGEYFKTLL